MKHQHDHRLISLTFLLKQLFIFHYTFILSYTLFWLHLHLFEFRQLNHPFTLYNALSIFIIWNMSLANFVVTKALIIFWAFPSHEGFDNFVSVLIARSLWSSTSGELKVYLQMLKSHWSDHISRSICCYFDMLMHTFDDLCSPSNVTSTWARIVVKLTWQPVLNIQKFFLAAAYAEVEVGTSLRVLIEFKLCFNIFIHKRGYEIIFNIDTSSKVISLWFYGLFDNFVQLTSYNLLITRTFILATKYKFSI